MAVRLKIALAILALAPAILAAGADAAQLAKEAEQAERKGDIVRAYHLYARAAMADRMNLRYWAKERQLRAALPPTGQLRVQTLPPALNLNGAPPESEPSASSGVLTLRVLEEVDRMASPPSLVAAQGTRDFKLKVPARKLFETVAAAYGLEAYFERDYPSEDRLVRFEIQGADYREALYAVQRATNSFIAPISKRGFLVAVDTVQKRQDYEPTVARVFEVPQRTSPQEAQEMLALLQQTLEIRRAQLDFQKRQILLRDRAAKVEVAEAVLHSLLNYKAQVAVEVELISVSETSTLSAGVGLGTSFPLYNWGHDLAPGLAWTKPVTAAAYAIFGGGATILGLGIADGSLFANITKGRSQSLIRSEIVSSDGQAATLHIGDRYPIVTSQFVGATAQPGENVVAPPPTFNFEDLGLVLKVTPVVHGMDEMSLEVETEFKTLGAEGTNGIPIINTRKLQSRVRMKNSEWAIVAGLASESELSTLSGFAGLADIPVLGKILSRNTRTKENAQVLVLIKPKLLSAPPGTKPTRLFWLGTETKPLTSL